MPTCVELTDASARREVAVHNLSSIRIVKDDRGDDRISSVVSFDRSGWKFGREAELAAGCGLQALFHPKRLIGAQSGGDLQRITEVVAKHVHSVLRIGGRSIIEMKNGSATGRISSVDALASVLKMWLRSMGLTNLTAVIAVPANFTAVRHCCCFPSQVNQRISCIFLHFYWVVLSLCKS